MLRDTSPPAAICTLSSDACRPVRRVARLSPSLLLCALLLVGTCGIWRGVAAEAGPQGEDAGGGPSKEDAPTSGAGEIIHAYMQAGTKGDSTEMEGIYLQGTSRLDDWLEAILVAEWPGPDKHEPTYATSTANLLAAYVLGDIESPTDPTLRMVIDTLFDAALTGARQTRLRALGALGVLGIPRAEEVTPRLLPLLASTDASIVAAAARTLGGYGPRSRKARDRLRLLMVAKEPEVVVAAAFALSRSGDHETVLRPLPKDLSRWSPAQLKRIGQIRAWSRRSPKYEPGASGCSPPVAGGGAHGLSGRYVSDGLMDEVGSGPSTSKRRRVRRTLDLRPDQSFSFWFESLWIFEDPVNRIYDSCSGRWSMGEEGQILLHALRSADGRAPYVRIALPQGNQGLEMLEHTYARARGSQPGPR